MRKRLVLALAKHVGDIKITGEWEVIVKLLKWLDETFGPLTVTWGNFDDWASTHVRHPDDSIETHQNSYAAALKPVALPLALKPETS